MKKPNHGFTLVEVIIVFIIVALLATMTIPAFRKVRNARSPEYQRKVENEQRALHSAWSKAHPTIDLTFEEWRALDQRGMLPK